MVCIFFIVVRGRIGSKHSHASQVQPEPKLEAAAALNLSTKSLKDPKSLSISLRRSPLGFPPPPGSQRKFCDACPNDNPVFPGSYAVLEHPTKDRQTQSEQHLLNSLSLLMLHNSQPNIMSMMSVFILLSLTCSAFCE